MPRRMSTRRPPPHARALTLALLLACVMGTAGAASLPDAAPAPRSSRFT